MLVIDDSNYQYFLGDGYRILAGGEERLLSRTPRPLAHDSGRYSRKFGDVFTLIPRSEWPARIKEQEEKKSRVSDFQNFPPHDQNGLPTCWANGPAHAFTTQRVMQGLPLVFISACSLAVPISGGHRGGYEGDALEYLAKYGGVSTEFWPNNSTSRSLETDAKCEADRANHMSLEVYELEGFDQFVTAALLGYPSAVAYDWWSHVVMGCDVAMIEKGSFGYRIRNNWGDWGDSNEYGQPGYSVMREGKGTPDSGFCFRQVTPSVA